MFLGQKLKEGERAAPREKVPLYASTAYAVMRPPMELPEMKVCSLSGTVGYLESM